MTTQPVLVVGGTGNVGNSVVRTLREEGHTVRGLTRDSAGLIRCPAPTSRSSRLNGRAR
jgi:nucleoside-diphosphate-sugar epimerase